MVLIKWLPKRRCLYPLTNDAMPVITCPSETLPEELASAIRQQRVVEFLYQGRARAVRFHALTKAPKGLVGWGYQVAGDSSSGTACDLYTLKCFYLDKFEEFTTVEKELARALVLEKTFAKNPNFGVQQIGGELLELIPDCIAAELVSCEVVLLDLTGDAMASQYNRKTRRETPIHLTLSVGQGETLEAMVDWFVKSYLCLNGELTYPEGVEWVNATVQNISKNCVKFRFPTKIDKEYVNSILVASSGTL